MTGEHRIRRPLTRSIIILLLVAALVLLALRLVAEPMRVSSDSMTPTYSAGDEVLVEKVSPGARDPERGAVVVFRRPDSDELMIKRVVALGDQTVAIRDGLLTVDGQHPSEPYVGHIVAGSYFGPVRVPDGAVFVLGDRRLGSVDSRTFGAVPIDDVVGRVVLRIWPP